MESGMAAFLKTLKVVSLVLAALIIGAAKAFIIGPIASAIIIGGTACIVFGLLPAHVVWTVNCLLRTPLFDIGLKAVLIVLALPPVAALSLAIGIAGCILSGFGYGCFAPWVATFEAFRQESRSSKLTHCITDGTWSTIKRSCTVVRDFLDLSYHSYRAYLKEFQEKYSDSEPRKINLYEVPVCFVAGLVGLVVEVILFTAVVIVKSPYMLLRGWQRLLQDLISREGPFLETACVPIAGLFFFLWPLYVIACSLFAIFSSFFVGLYAAVVAYQECSFWRGMAYIIAMVADFDEYTNDILYLREGTCLPRPNYRKSKASKSSDVSVPHKRSSTSQRGMILPTLTTSRSLRETIQEVKMVQIWEETMKSFERRGKELVNANVLRSEDFEEWFKASKSTEKGVISVGLPSYALLCFLHSSAEDGTAGLRLHNGLEITSENRPQDHFMDRFFNPLLILRDQIRAAKLMESELKYLEKLTLMSSNTGRTELCENGEFAPENAVRNGEIQAISRRCQGLARNISKFPTYRRRYQHLIKVLYAYAQEKERILKPRYPKMGSPREGPIQGGSSGTSRTTEINPAIEIN